MPQLYIKNIVRLFLLLVILKVAIVPFCISQKILIDRYKFGTIILHFFLSILVDHILNLALKLMLNFLLLNILILLEHVFFHLRLESNFLDDGVFDCMLHLLGVFGLFPQMDLFFLRRLLLVRVCPIIIRVRSLINVDDPVLCVFDHSFKFRC